MIARALLPVLIAGSLQAQVSFDRLLNADQEPQNWLTYSGSYASQRHSTLDQITPANVKKLEMHWAVQARSLEKFEATPLVVDGVMYVTEPPSTVVAVDGATGRTLWTYSYRSTLDGPVCCGRVNRGLAILGGSLFLGAIDAHLIAIEAKTGHPLWNVPVGDAAAGYAITLAPLVIKDKVIVGVAGGECGIRGFLAAFDAATGKEAWRFNTVPGPGEPGNETWPGDTWKHGGVPVWMTGSYDPNLNLTYWGLGNPGPDYNADSRPGDNLYSDCVVALDADTGKLKWYFQFTPHDELDYDSVQVPVLADMDWQGKPRKVMLWANRNGFFYVLDQVNGQFLSGKPFVKVTWASGLDERGRPMKVANMSPTTDGTAIYPGVQGGTNWYSPSYSPRTGLFYVQSWVNTGTLFTKFPVEYEAGKRYSGGIPRLIGNPGRGEIATPVMEESYGAVRALDPKTGDRKWEFKMSGVTQSGVLSTVSGLVFTGSRDGSFFALDATTGAELWRATVGGPVNSSPMTYSAGGKQYVAIAAGSALFAFALPE